MNGSTGNGKGRVLARLLRVSGSMKRDVKLEKDGAYGPSHVFKTVSFDAIGSVENKVTEM